MIMILGKSTSSATENEIKGHIQLRAYDFFQLEVLLKTRVTDTS